MSRYRPAGIQRIRRDNARTAGGAGRTSTVPVVSAFPDLSPAEGRRTWSVTPPYEHNVVGQRARKDAGQRLWVVRGRQRHAPGPRITDLEVREPAFRGDAAQIDFEQRGAMRRIREVLERGEPLLRDQGEDAEQAELVRCGDDDPAARTRDSMELAAKRPGVLEMLDCLDRRHDVG